MKRFLIIFIIIALIIFSIWIIYNVNGINKKNENIIEIIPEQEISDDQMRQTIVSLYFKSGNELVPEARLIDVKQLLNNPYEEILNMLIEGPKNGNLEKTIPEGTKLLKVEKQKDILTIDLSEEFINNHCGGENEERITINSLLNTITELTEINSIKILINGKPNKAFADNIINFNNIFER